MAYVPLMKHIMENSRRGNATLQKHPCSDLRLWLHLLYRAMATEICLQSKINPRDVWERDPPLNLHTLCAYTRIKANEMKCNPQIQVVFDWLQLITLCDSCLQWLRELFLIMTLILNAPLKPNQSTDNKSSLFTGCSHFYFFFIFYFILF